jgi:hypothetical protein
MKRRYSLILESLKSVQYKCQNRNFNDGSSGGVPTAFLVGPHVRALRISSLNAPGNRPPTPILTGNIR